MALSFQDKIKPVSTATPAVASASAPSSAPAVSFADKIKPVETPTAPVATPEQPALTDSFVGGLPVIKQLTQFGVGLGTNIAKAGLGLGQAFLKGANVIGNIGGSDHNQYDPLIQGIEDIKQKVYTEPFKKEKNTIAGTLGTLTGEAAQFATPGTAITKVQSLAEKGYEATKVAQKLASGNALGKVVNYVGKKLLSSGIEAGGTGATIYGTSGGDTGEAVGAGLGAGIISGLGHVGFDALKAVIPQSVKENVARVFGFTGKKSLGGIASGGTTDSATGAMQTITNLAPDIKITDMDGIEKPFIPSKATFLDLPQALSQAKEKIYQAYHDLATKAGQKGGQFVDEDFLKIVNDLDKYSQAGYTPSFTNKAKQFLDAIERYAIRGKDGAVVGFKATTPAEIETLIKNINKDVNPLSDKAGAEVAQDVSQKLRQLMDEKITAATGNPEYQKLRDAYGQLKSIEGDVISKWKVAMRKAGVQPGLIDGIISVDGLMGLLTGNPAQFGRALTAGTIKKIFTYLRDPEVNLRRAFKLLEEQKGKNPVKPTSAKVPVKSLPSEYTNLLPTIDAGATPKPKASNLPTAEGAPNVYTPPVKAPKTKSPTGDILPYTPEKDLPVIQTGAKPKSKYQKTDPNLPTIEGKASMGTILGTAGAGTAAVGSLIPSKTTYQKPPEAPIIDETASQKGDIASKNNNPGNLIYMGQEGAIKGEKRPDGTYWAVFNNPEAGYKAMGNDVQAKLNRRPEMTLRELIETRSPGSDGNNLRDILYNISDELFDIKDKDGKIFNGKSLVKDIPMDRLLKAIAKSEGFKG